MRRSRRAVGFFLKVLVLFGVLAATANVALAQGDAAVIPDNARAAKFGGGWECELGYRKIDPLEAL